MDDRTRSGFGIALNEATLVGFDVSQEQCRAVLTFEVLSLPPDDGPSPADPRVLIHLSSVGRMAASLHQGHWDDPEAKAIPLTLESLIPVVESFRAPVYGWEFIDIPDSFARWSNRLSLDEHLPGGGLNHSITLFQEGPDRHLDLCIWFDSLRIFRPDGTEISLDDFAAAGKRWWDGLSAGDPRTQGHGIIPGAPPKASQ